MPLIEFSAKSLRFTIHALERQVAELQKQLDALSSEDDDRASELGNDQMAYMEIAKSLQKDYRKHFPPVDKRD